MLGSRFNESAAMFSTDGRLLAYVSDETGHNEVYVQPFPGPGARRQVSVGGGTGPLWGRQRGELFYQDGTSMMAAAVQTGMTLQSSPPAGSSTACCPGIRRRDGLLGHGTRGQGFVMPRQLEQKQATTLMLALNWAPDAARRGKARD